MLLAPLLRSRISWAILFRILVKSSESRTLALALNTIGLFPLSRRQYRADERMAIDGNRRRGYKKKYLPLVREGFLFRVLFQLSSLASLAGPA
jgi:hypothetical protein